MSRASRSSSSRSQESREPRESRDSKSRDSVSRSSTSRSSESRESRESRETKTRESRESRKPVKEEEETVIKKTVRKSRKADVNYPDGDQYKQATQRETIYKHSTDMYIGPPDRLNRLEYTFPYAKFKQGIYKTLKDVRIRQNHITVPYGMERLFLELLSNASDNISRSIRTGYNDNLFIDVKMDRERITVTNGGLPMPIVEKKTLDGTYVYIPEFTLGTLLTSSNYETERHEAGKNGIGAKACNIFSKRFEVVVCDHVRKLKYEQSWENNMTVRNKPVITEYDEDYSTVSVSYVIDFERFGYKSLKDKESPADPHKKKKIVRAKDVEDSDDAEGDSGDSGTRGESKDTKTDPKDTKKGVKVNVKGKSKGTEDTKSAKGDTKDTKDTKNIKNTKGTPGKQGPLGTSGPSGDPEDEIMFDVNAEIIPVKITGYPEEAFDLFCRHCSDTAYNSKCDIKFNGIKFESLSLKEYARCYFGNSVDNALVHYEYPPDTDMKEVKGKLVPVEPDVRKTVEMLVCYTPDNSKNVSYVNSLMTSEGGVHIDVAVDQVGRKLIDIINQKTLKSLNSGKDNQTAKLDSSQKLNIGDVRAHISIFLACWVVNASFADGQTKSKLRGPKPIIKLNDKEFEVIKKWGLQDRLKAALESKQYKDLMKKTVKKGKHIDTKKLNDANLAGTKNGHKCSLCVTEGNSAMGYINTVITLMKDGRDTIGTLPLKGKVLNVMNASLVNTVKNVELMSLREALGLEDGLDYSDPKNFKRLRYGKLIIVADSDDDGKHIVGLVLLFFYTFFPSLLAREYCSYYRTPIIRLEKGVKSLGFLSMREFEEWKKVNSMHGWKASYIKGLGTSTDEQVAIDYKDQRIVDFYTDKDHDYAFNLGFNAKWPDRRKKWISGYEGSDPVEELKRESITQFVDNELILFSMADMSRSLPSLFDGMKVTQRKILFALMKKYNPKMSSVSVPSVSKINVLTGIIISETDYGHGEKSIEEAVYKMCQDFVGTNNLPPLHKGSQVGTRLEGGADHPGSRYGKTATSHWLPFVYREEDKCILKYTVGDEGEQLEPVIYYPIIPMGLVNGSCGIGSGWSNFVPNHNPLDIIDILIDMIEDRTPGFIRPWYRDFKGQIIMKTKERKVGEKRKQRKLERLKRTYDADELKTIKVRKFKLNKTKKGSEKRDKSAERSEKKEGEDEKFKFEKGEDEPESEEESDEEHEVVDLDQYSDHSSDGGNSDEESQVDSKYTTFVTKGVWTRTGKDIVITELPIGRWTTSYGESLKDLVMKKKIEDIRDTSDNDVVRFELTGVDPEYHSSAKLRLTRSFAMTNLIYLDDENNGKPRRFQDVYDILNEYYRRRLNKYEERRQRIITDIEQNITNLSDKMRFIQAVLDRKLVIEKRKTDDIKKDMTALKLPVKLLGEVLIKNFTQEELNKLQAEIDKLTSERDHLKVTRPEDIWKKELIQLRDYLLKKYKGIFDVGTKAEIARRRGLTKKYLPGSDGEGEGADSGSDSGTESDSESDSDDAPDSE